MKRLLDLIHIYRQYRRHHSRTNAWRIAWGCAIQGLPF